MTDKPICPHYDDEFICDCPYESIGTIGFILAGVICPPAEKIKDDIIDAAIEADQFKRHGVIDTDGVVYGPIDLNEGRKISRLFK